MSCSVPGHRKKAQKGKVDTLMSLLPGQSIKQFAESGFNQLTQGKERRKHKICLL